MVFLYQKSKKKFLSSIFQLLVEENGSTRTLIMNRPKQLNALSSAMVFFESSAVFEYLNLLLE